MSLFPDEIPKDTRLLLMATLTMRREGILRISDLVETRDADFIVRRWVGEKTFQVFRLMKNVAVALQAIQDY